MGTSQLYFLHIPKTAGSSITRLLDDSWPAGAVAPYRFIDELEEAEPGELERYDVISGHHGIVPATDGRQVVTLLRDPVRRAWSHYRALGPGGDVDPLGRFATFGALLDDPVYSWIARDYQARWLAIPPAPARGSLAGLPPGAPGRDPGGASVEPGDLEARALAVLRRCALAGTVERVDDFVEALGRLVGRPLAAPPRLNVGSGGGPPAAEATRVRELSPVDARLHAAADAELDRALATLPELPREPRVELPYRHTMSDPLYGTGWHARLDSPAAGWHRWTGPGVRSELRLPLRAAGPARLEIAVLSACDDDAVRSLRLEVQGRPVERSEEPRRLGVAAIADVVLDPRLPLTLALEVAHTRHLADSASGERSPDPAGLAVGDIALSPA